MSIDKQAEYYMEGGIEVIDVIRAKLTEEQFYGYCLGNCMKYVMRANWKQDKQRDIEKAEIYLKEIRNETKNNDLSDV